MGKRHVKATANRLVVGLLEGRTTTASGLVLPRALEYPLGVVLDSACEALPVGALVLCSKYAGTDVTVDDTRIRVMREEDVIGIVDEGDGVTFEEYSEQDGRRVITVVIPRAA